MNSILLALQFFTSWPVHRELPMGKKEVSGMYIALPVIGGAIGALLAAVLLLAVQLGFNGFLAAILVLLAGLVATGGLHADGFADTGDAFFSYRDRERRLDIMEDPRLGAFGTMSILVLFILKIGVFIELAGMPGGWLLLIAGPLLSRAALVVYFVGTPTAKRSGIASFFQQHFLPGRMITGVVLTALIALSAIGFYFSSVLAAAVTGLLLIVSVYLFRRWSLKHFGGVTGDLCGAFIEGMEVVIWLILIVSISSGI